MSADGEPEPEAADSAEREGPSPASDPARRLLARARRTKPIRKAQPRQAAESRWSGAGPDPRDPAPIGGLVNELVRDRNWERTLTAAGLLPRWAEIVGEDIAAHCRPDRLVDGELTCIAESTAWATQLRLMSRQLMARIIAEVGPGVVTKLKVRGPTAPDWRHGPLRVMGRGPRDTYG
ncbi:MAG TPA: DciA family protein [Mycobacteriales bacterium]|nr:DciA family protein [Mycobacteriales bacterium]